MRPKLWSPPVALSAAERTILARIKRAKLFIFLRLWRHELFDAAFQAELAAAYQARRKGQPPVPPAQLALATVLQAYTGVSDDEVIEATVMDRRWQLVLDCHDAARPPFSKGTLVAFRQRLIAHDLDRRLIERTVELAERVGKAPRPRPADAGGGGDHGGAETGFSPRALRAALDSSPLWGAGRVEDTYNLLGHALRKALALVARQSGQSLADVATAAGAPVLGGTSLKAALDLNWDEAGACERALRQVLAALDAVERYLATQPVHLAPPPVAAQVQTSLDAAHQVRAQDVELVERPVPTAPAAPAAPAVAVALVPVLRQRVARDRRISFADGAMRHGRKSKAQRVDGYKRHALRDLDLEVVRAVALTPANVPEAHATDALGADLARQAVVLREFHIDRAYLSSTLVRERPPELAIFCKAWPVRANGDRFAKTAFTLDWDDHTIRCPNNAVVPFTPGGTVHFPADTCAVCPLHDRCTTSPAGRSVTVHPDEHLLAELRARQHTAAGRAQLRARVAIEHTLAHLGQWQGDRARYLGERKNLFDLRRTAVVHNLHVIARAPAHPAISSDLN